MNIIKKVLYKIVKLYWKIFQPVTTGVRAIILNETNDKILLVNHSYTKGWYLPGGQLNKKEKILDGLKRELKEEINFQVNDYKLLGIYNNFYEGKNDNIMVFICSGEIVAPSKSDEIKDFAYFDLSSLPKDVSPGTQKRIKEFINKEYGIVDNW